MLDKRIIVLTNKNNKGPLVSRNLGMDFSNGNYVAFLDHDDLWRVDKLEIQINYMIQNNWCFTYTNYRKFRFDSKALSNLIKSPKVYTLSKLLTNTGVALSSVIYNKAKLGLVHFEDVRPYTEFSLYLRLISLVNKGYLVPHDLLKYRITEVSMSKNKLSMAKLVWKNYSKLGFGFIFTAYFFVNYMIRGFFKYLK
jgi:teichuronic acid biosynthesis glycosyltransferase TuaG